MQTAATDTEEELATRQVILQAAYEEIHVRGFQAASLSKILANTNVTKGALYHYFPTKLALGYAVVDEILAEQIQQQWVQPLLQTDDPVTGLIQIIKQAGQELTEEDIYCGCPLNNLAQEMAPVDEGFRSRVEFVYEAWRTGTETAFKNGQDKGFVKKEINATSVATMIVASLEGCMGLAKNARSKKMLYQCGESVMDYLQSLRT
ncbi:MAG: TetR/AcrR family transcriptional regulator [Gammaproteobacteria bacterium]|nr:TetR/AcrR family transcriptional regulator [Gammaproteobacteria bacterium]MBT8123535.1 TetR/AcrR family transcriptional regulator [Gammaproteobacteria bacterium]NNC68420.1 TetR/AcrR family transcriptional regulator [Gammaproteobacteria bacterium]